MNAACTPNGTATRFVPGSGIILQSSVLPPTFARRGRQGFAAGFRQAAPHSAAPPCVLIPSIRLYGSARPTVRAMAALIFPPQASNEKTPPRGATARRGVVSQRRKRGSASTRPTWEDAFIKGSGCRFDSRLWNPEIIDCALPAPVSHVGQPSGLHWMSFYPRKRTNSRHLRRSAVCQKRTLARLFDHVVGAGEKRFRDGQSDRRCGLEVYDQLEFGRQLNRQLRGICTL